MDKDLQKKLTPQQYEVTQNKGTERPFTGKYYIHNEEGVYACIVCGHELFSSEAKFDSQTGWPSFDSPINSTNLIFSEDTSHGMNRTEVQCANCNAHLGHVFPTDKPTSKNQHFCINSCSLDFKSQ